MAGEKNLSSLLSLASLASSYLPCDERFWGSRVGGTSQSKGGDSRYDYFISVT